VAVLAYHADGEILRWWAIVGLAGAAVIAVAIALTRRLPPGRDRPNTAALVAIALAALTALSMVTRFFIIGVLLGLLALIPAVWAASRPGGRTLAVTGFTAGLLAFDLGMSAVAACAITDACFH